MITYRAGYGNICQAVKEMGIRACLGKLVKFTETNRQLSITDPRDRDLISMSTQTLLDAYQQYHHSYNDRLHVWAAVGTPRGAPMSSFRELAEICGLNGISMTMHCAEAPNDLNIYHDNYHCSPMEFIRDTKMCGQLQEQVQKQGTHDHSRVETSDSAIDDLSHNLVLAHMVNLDKEIDIPLLSTTKTSVAHNPSSNLKLGSGIASISEMLSEKYIPRINISLGTDGGPCSNHYDLFQEMHLASILQKGINNDAGLISAELALEMATINGAKAIGLDHDIGSLEVGKKADFVVLDPFRFSHCVHGGLNLAAAPWDPDDSTHHGVSPVTIVVHSCTGRDVDMTVVDGKVLVKDGILVDGGLDKEIEILGFAQMAVKGIVRRCNDTGTGLGHHEIKGKLAPGWKYV